MNLISRLRILGRLALLAITVCVVSLFTSCLTATESSAPTPENFASERGFKFGHDLHLQAGLDDCSVCHDPDADLEGALSTPAHDLCSVCHDVQEYDAAALPDDPTVRESCNFCHTNKDFSVQPWRTSLSDEILFKHEPHVTAELECSACHANPDQGSPEMVPMKPFCMECHEQQPRAELTNCSTCHSEIDMDYIPQFRHGERIAHDAPGVWEKIHGQESRVDAAYCAMCHEEQNRCDDCHTTHAPSNHTMSFKNRTHGHHATWDRKTCAVCHEESTCQQCHEEKAPVSHRRGNWSGVRNTHCVNCHFPPERTGCAVCHENIEHFDAKPSPHALGIYPPNCARCHPGGLPTQAPHMLNSTVHCTVCHK